MRNLKIAALAILCMVTIAPVATGQQINGCSLPDSELRTQIFFGNGIRTTPLQAQLTALELQLAYLTDLTAARPEETFTFAAAYNASSGLIADTNEVLLQKLMEVGIDDVVQVQQMWILLSVGLTLDAIHAVIRDALDDPEPVILLITPNWIEATRAALSSVLGTFTEQEATHERHINHYSNALLAGHRVIVFAHSQGNLFANNATQAVINRLPNESVSMAVIGVASPASRTVGSNRYITALDDRVIDALRLFSSVLPGNIENDPGIFNDNRDGLNHNFSLSYFAEELASRSWIDAEFLRYINQLPFPSQELGEGALRATLNWGTEPDVDLHVFEPNGTHVYYANRFGQSGELDRDDVNSFGPENYFVPCDMIQEGQYRIGVNYYRGSAPEVAEVSLILGDGQIPAARRRTLPRALGSSGNNSPLILFTVDVSYDASTERVTYQIN